MFVSSSMTISIYLAGQSVAGILSESELDSTPQGKYNYVVFCTFLPSVLEVANRSPAW